jgi:hypothetical protein
VDAGGATERALASGAKPAPPPASEDDDGILKMVQDAAAAFTPILKVPNLGEFDVAASLPQAADQVVADNTPKLPLPARGEAPVEEARRILDGHVRLDESLDLPAPTIGFSGKCCSADELQRFRIGIEAPRNALQGSINAFKRPVTAPPRVERLPDAETTFLLATMRVVPESLRHRLRHPRVLAAAVRSRRLARARAPQGQRSRPR